MWILPVGVLVKINRWKYLSCEELMESRWNSFCLHLLDCDVLVHLQHQQIPYLRVTIWCDSVTIVSTICVYNSDFTKLRMWLQMQYFQVVDRESWQITGECRTPHWTLPVLFWHLAHTLASTYWRSPACFQTFIFPSATDYIFALSLLFISLLEIVEGKSENLLTSCGERLCPTKFGNLFS